MEGKLIGVHCFGPTLAGGEPPSCDGPRRYRLLALVVLLAFAMVCCNRKGARRSKSGPVISPAAAADLTHLLDATLNARAARAIDIRAIQSRASTLTPDSPTWPVYAYLLGEVLRLRGNAFEARKVFSELASWAAADPYHDGNGGSSLASVALWRWLQLISGDASPDRAEAARLLEVYQKLKDTRLMRGMFQAVVLSTLPQMEEDITRRLAILAWSTGRTDHALRLFLQYLTIARTAELSPPETQMVQRLLTSGLASADQLTLFRGERLLDLGSYDEAAKLLTQARKSDIPDVHNRAGLSLARLRRIQGAPRKVVAELLGSVIQEATDPEVAETALFQQAIVLNREGLGRDVPGFLRDLNQLIENYPQGHLTDDAMFQLGRYWQYTGDVDQAVSYFERVRALKDSSNLAGTATLAEAFTLYARGEPGDIVKAMKLLQELCKQEPPTTLRPPALFWLGRMAAESGDQARSNEYFQRIITETPYDYYAIRARMHLSLGNAARKELWSDAMTKRELRNAYQASSLDTSLSLKSPYHMRLAAALGTQLYSTALAAQTELRKSFPSRRLEDLSVKELDDTGLLAHLALLLALRQDASAANGTVYEPENRLQIAGAVGQIAGDWPMAMGLVVASGEPFERRAAAQRDEHYLATAYPLLYSGSFREAGSTEDVPPELLYSIAREESLFYPAALSKDGALGLMQFTVPTFRRLDKRWSLLKTSGAASSHAFLLDPKLSIGLGARWYKTLIKNVAGHMRILLVIMENNAGLPAVREWVAYWTRLGRADDVEYAIETARFVETRIFARRVLADMEIIDATGAIQPHQ